MGRPAKKKRYVEAKATRKGELQAEYEFSKAHSVTKKPLEFLETRMEKQIDKVNWIETGAILGTTLIVHGIISSNKEWVSKALEFGKMWSTEAASAAVENWLRQATGQEQKPKVLIDMPDWAVWLASLSIAYIVIKQGGQLIGLMEKGLNAVVPMLLGAA